MFYRFSENHCSEKNAEQDSGIIVDTDLVCRLLLVKKSDKYLSERAEETDQHQEQELAQIRHDKVSDHERQGTEHAECGKVHDDGNSIDFSFKIP